MMNFTRTIDAVDAHTAGEPIRIVTAGVPKINGGTMLEKMSYFAEHYDVIRRLLIMEPRGHKEMFGSILVPPVTDDGDMGVLFMHNEGMSTMCGHGIIGTVKAAAETGIITVHEGTNTVRIDAPAGRITAEAVVKDGHAESVSFTNVPAFVYMKSIDIPVDGIGTVNAAIAYGGAFYIFVEEEKLGLRTVPEQNGALVARAMEMKRWVNNNVDIRHPEKPDIHGIYGVLITSPVERTQDGCKSRHICVFAEGSTDRSPCGTGTSARTALLVSRGQLKVGEKFEAESIIGTKFTAQALSTAKAGGYDAIIPKITGNAWITGFNKFVLDPTDPISEGFLI